MYLKHSINTNGRDFICSDIHGRFDLLEAELAKAKFDYVADRVFCLGDLIDRGELSKSVLEWVAKPWFHSIQGNHERMLIRCVKRRTIKLWDEWMMWGGEWAEHLSYEELEPYSAALKQLPLVAEIQLNSHQSVALVHAELPNECDWANIVQEAGKLLPDAIDASFFAHDILWRKNQAYANENEVDKINPVKNIEHVFHGHAIVSNIKTITNRTFMDLGSYKTNKIGFLNVKEFLIQR